MVAKIIDIFTKKPKRKTRVKRWQARAHHRKVIDEMVDECREFGDPDIELFVKIHKDVCDDELAMSDILAIYLLRKKLASYRRD